MAKEMLQLDADQNYHQIPNGNTGEVLTQQSDGGKAFFPVPSPAREEIVNADSDFPDPFDNGDLNGNGYRLGDIKYSIGQDISILFPIIPSTGTDESLRFDGNNYQNIEYAGNGAMFRANLTSSPTNCVIDHVTTKGDGSNTFLDYQTKGTLSIFEGTVSGFSDLGTFDGDLLQVISTTFLDNADSLKVDATTILYMSGCAFQDSTPYGKAQLDISGSFLSALVTDSQFIPVAGDYAFRIDPNITGNVNLTNINVIKAFGGLAFDPSGLDQTDPKVKTSNVTGMPESQINGSLGWVSNTIETVIPAINTWVKLAGVTYEDEFNERCSQTQSNRLTFTNQEQQVRTAIFRIDARRGIGASSPTARFALYKNGSPMLRNGQPIVSSGEMDAADPVSITFNALVSVVAGDYFEVWGINVTNDSNLLITNGSHTIS